MAKKVLVIRVGSRTTHIVHMDNVDDEPSIYGCMRVTTPEGCVSDGQIIDVTDLARVIVKTMKEKHISCKDAIFVIPSSKIASREATMPAVSKQRMGALVQARVGDLFPVDVEQYVFSHVLQGKPYKGGEETKLATEQDFDKLVEAEEGKGDDKKKKKKKKGDSIESADDSELVQDVLVFAAPTELVNSYYALADAIGVKISSLEADGNSVFQIMKRQVGSGTSLSIQINRDSTLVNVVNQDKLLLQRVVPYGVNVFTDAIQEEPAFRCETFDKAYKLISSQRVLMPHLGVENTSDDFSLQKRIEVTNNGDYLIGNIIRVVEYYNAQHRGEPIQNVSLIGWGCSIVGIHELLSNELGLPTTTPTEIAGVRFNRKVEISISMLQYLNCMGAVFAPVNFISKDVAEKDAKKGTMVGPILIFGLLVCVAAVIAGWSYLNLFTARDERDAAQMKVNSMASIEPEYNELLAIEKNYGTYKGVKVATDLNNNHLRQLLDDIQAICPASFTINSIVSDGKTVTINADSYEKLSSVSALIIQLNNNIPMIRNVWIETIQSKKPGKAKNKDYGYTMTFEFIANELKAAQELSDVLTDVMEAQDQSTEDETVTAVDNTEGGDQ